MVLLSQSHSHLRPVQPHCCCGSEGLQSLRCRCCSRCSRRRLVRRKIEGARTKRLREQRGQQQQQQLQRRLCSRGRWYHFHEVTVIFVLCSCCGSEGLQSLRCRCCSPRCPRRRCVRVPSNFRRDVWRQDCPPRPIRFFGEAAAEPSPRRSTVLVCWLIVRR